MSIQPASVRQENIWGIPEGDEATLSGLLPIGESLAAACDRFAHLKAVTCMGSTITFQQLGRLTDAFAAYLLNDLGLKKGDRLAIMLPNVIQFPIAFLGAQKAGIVCVNTNPLYTPREMKHQFADSGAKAIIILDMFLGKLEKIIDETDLEYVIATGIGDQLPIWKNLLVSTVLKIKKQVPDHNLSIITFNELIRRGMGQDYTRPKVDLNDTALLQYTGGTTGVSKGGELTHRSIMANVKQMQYALGRNIPEGEETVLTALPLYHIFALSVNFMTFLKMGHHMILVPKPVPIENTVKTLAKYRPTVMSGVNTLYNALNNCKAFQDLAPKNIKVAVAGGMALQESVARAFQRITGTTIVEGYGLTEASPVTHVCPLDIVARTGSIGFPVPFTEAKVVDPDGKEVTTGEVGELIIRGPQVMKGYWQRPDETRKTIRKGWLWTGDMARVDADGWYYIVDRKKDMILVSGFNVFPNEVEDVLAAHPKVLEAAVVGVPDDKTGEAVKAFVVKKDESLTVDELKKYCAEELTNYKRPKYWEFRQELPKTPVGKILRKELRNGDSSAQAH